MDKFVEQFDFLHDTEESHDRFRHGIYKLLYEASDVGKILSMLSALKKKVAISNFPAEFKSYAAESVKTVVDNLDEIRVDKDRDLPKIRSMLLDIYLTCLEKGPTSGHLECMNFIQRRQIGDYIREKITKEELKRLTEAFKMDLEKKGIKVDENYKFNLMPEFDRTMDYLSDDESKKHFEGEYLDSWMELYNHNMMLIRDDKGKKDLLNSITLEFIGILHIKLNLEEQYKHKDRAFLASQLEIIEKVCANLKGKTELNRNLVSQLEDSLKCILSVLREKNCAVADLVDDVTGMLLRLCSHNTQVSRKIAEAIVYHAGSRYKWPLCKVDIAGKYLPEFNKVTEEASPSNEDNMAWSILNKTLRYILLPYVKSPEQGKHLLPLINICLKKKQKDFLEITRHPLDRDYDKFIKWRGQADWCKTYLQTMLSLEDLPADANISEKERKELYKEYAYVLKKLDDKHESFRLLPAVSKDLALVLEKGVVQKSQLHLHAMKNAYEHIVWQKCKDLVFPIMKAICDYVFKPDEYTGIVTGYLQRVLQYMLRSVVEMKMTAEVSDLLRSTLQECVGKPCATDTNTLSVFFSIGLPIISEFCFKILEDSDTGSKFVPILIDIAVSKPEDSFAEQIISLAQNTTRIVSAYPKTVAEHVDKLIDAYLDNNIHEGVIGVARASYPIHPEKINPRIGRLIEFSEDGDGSDKCNILQLLHLVAKQHPELWDDQMHNKIIESLSIKNMIGLALYCLNDVYPKHPSRMIDDLDVLFPALKKEIIYISVLYQTFPAVAAVSEEYAQKILAKMDDVMRNLTDVQAQTTLIMSYRSIASSHSDLVNKRRSFFEERKQIPALSQQCCALLDFLDGKSLEDVYQEVDIAKRDIDDLDIRVKDTEENVSNVSKEVDQHHRDIKHIKEDVTKAEVKLDDLTGTVEEMGEKVEEIDHKTLNHAPAWSRDVSLLLNPESPQDWRLLAQRLGYSNDDIRGWATQADPCMATLNEWFATHKTSEAVHAVYKSLTEMNRTDAAEIVKKAMDSAEHIIDDEEEEYEDPPPVFISYQWGHQEKVKLLRRHLEMAGYKGWMDIGQMGGGDKLFAKIDQGMRAAKVIICCVTDKYAKSDNCTREVNLAVTLGKPIIPLLMEKSKWPPEGAMGPIFGEYLFIRFWQRGPELTPDGDQRYWPLMKFSELLMQIRLYIAPDLSLVTDGLYKDWCNPVEEDIEIEKTQKNSQIHSNKTSNQGNNQKGQTAEETPTLEGCDVFISYQWGKQPQIRKLYRRLTRMGYTCWMDIHQMGGGDSLYEKIDKGVRGCQVVVSCVTTKYALSANCRREVSLADALRKPIIPLLLEKMNWPPEGPMSMVLTQLLYISFCRDPDLQETWSGGPFDELIEKISLHVKPKFNTSPEMNTSSGEATQERTQSPIPSRDPVPSPGEIQASVRYLGSKKAFDAEAKWKKVKNVGAAAHASNAKSSKACVIL